MDSDRNDVQIYCLKCTNYTGSEEIKEDLILVKDTPRRLLKAICIGCKKQKSRFLKTHRKV